MTLRKQQARASFKTQLSNAIDIDGTSVLYSSLADTDPETMRELTDEFRHSYVNGVVVLGSVFQGKPMIVASSTDSEVDASELVKSIAPIIGGSGGGRKIMAQAGGKDASKLAEAISSAETWVREKKKRKRKQA